MKWNLILYCFCPTRLSHWHRVLRMARQIMQLHHGTAHADSHVDVLSMTMMIPAAKRRKVCQEDSSSHTADVDQTDHDDGNDNRAITSSVGCMSSLGRPSVSISTWFRKRCFNRLLNRLRGNAVSHVVWRSRDVMTNTPRLSRQKALNRVPTIDELRARPEWETGCPYCGHALERKANAFYKASLDRVDTTKNYYSHPVTHVANYVVCCQPCNYMRNDTDTDTFRHTLRIFAHSRSDYAPTQEDCERAQSHLATYTAAVRDTMAPRSDVPGMSTAGTDMAMTPSISARKACRFACMLGALYQDTSKWNRTPADQRIRSVETLRHMYIQQGGFHRGTNIPLLLDIHAPPRHLLIPSLDHIDPRGSSAVSNLQLVCYGFNTMKNKFSNEQALQHVEWLRSQRGQL